ncbi:hypothetical protein ETI93_02990 [Proteus mirabilis]|nr:hypothetical protein [Proteus mirabilis]MBN7267147.1 hypothetical protein [Proteus mirabilis]
MDNEDVWFYFLMCYFHEHYSELISVIFIISFIGIIWGIIHEMRWLSVFFTLPLLIFVVGLIFSNS